MGSNRGELDTLTVKAYGQRKVSLEVAKEDAEVMLGVTGVGKYEQDRYAFLKRDAAVQLRDWLNRFLDTGGSDA